MHFILTVVARDAAAHEKAQAYGLFRPDIAELITAFDEAQTQEEKLKVIADIFDDKQMGEALKNGVATIEQVSRVNAIAIAQMGQIQNEASKKAARRMSDVMLVSMLDQINDRIAGLEADLAEKYGENFAEDLLADLREQGLVEDEAYQRIMAIEDRTGRRQAIAELVNDGLENGTISEENLKGHAYSKEWLGLHEEAQKLRDEDAQLAVQGKKPLDELSTDANYEAGKSYVGNDATKASAAEATNEADINKKVDEGIAGIQSSAGFSLG